MIKNQHGILTLDFIFALLLGMTFTLVFFSLTMTLSLVEVAQYFSFSVARVSWAAHETRSLQLELGRKKFQELSSAPVFKVLFKGDWFKLGSPDFGDPLAGFNGEYAGTAPVDQDETFIGARIPIKATILNINVPLLGSSTTKPETGTANVQTFLGREVTTEECRKGFTEVRFAEILKLDPAYQNTPPAGAVLVTDNGC